MTGKEMELIASGENRAIKRLEAEVLKLGRMCDERGSNEARPTSGRKKAEGQSMKPEIIQAILGGEVIAEPEELTVTGTEARVCALIAKRQQLGIKKYGQTVEENPLYIREWLHHALEEALDMAIYLARAIEEIDAKSDGGR